jgi:hypothetical protein
VLRALRRRGLLTELSLAPFTPEETAELLHSVASPADPARVHGASGGNALFDLRGALGLDPNVPGGSRTILYTVRVKGNGTRAQYEEIHAKVMATSPNYYHIANPIALESKLVVL